MSFSARLWTRDGVLLLTAAAMVVVAASSVVLAVPGTQPIDLFACQLCDGRRYLAMAGGAMTYLPHAARILMPRLVGIFDLPDRPNAFEVINLASLAVLAAAAGSITWVAARRAGVRALRAGAAAAILIGILLILPMGLRWTRHYPVLVDPLADALVVLWLVLSAASHRVLSWLAVPVAAAAILTRETALVLVFAALLTQFYYSRNRRAFLPVGAATVLAMGVAALAVFLAPSLGDDRGPLWIYLIYWLRENTVTPYGAIGAGRWVLLCTGFLPLLLVRSPRRLEGLLNRDCASGTPLLMPALTLFLAGTLVGFASGNDVPRYLLFVSPFVLAITLTLVAVSPRLDIELGLALLASMPFWLPLAAFPDPVASDQFFADAYYPGQAWHYLSEGLVQASPFLAAWSLVAVVTIVTGLRRRSQTVVA